MKRQSKATYDSKLSSATIKTLLSSDASLVPNVPKYSFMEIEENLYQPTFSKNALIKVG